MQDRRERSSFVMCLIALALDAHENYPFILIANRDEFYKRPTKEAGFWEDQPEILGGRDLQAMGTWLGITKTGHIAALTNYREPGEAPKSRSRGNLPTQYLSANHHAEHYMKSVREKKDAYNGFNLIAGTFHELYYYSNRQEQITRIQKGIHAVSNHLLNTSWPKVDRIKCELSKYLADHQELDTDELFQLLSFSEPEPDSKLPHTGVPIEWERMLSPIYISSDTYGTRAQTVITVTKEGLVTFAERTAKKEGINFFQFILNPS